MANQKKWVCIYSSDSFYEIKTLESLLHNRGIEVNIYKSPANQLHDYLHDKEETIRLFIPEEKYEEGKKYTQQLNHDPNLAKLNS